MMGCNGDVDVDCADDEYPYHEVLLSSFALDRTEVTVAEYAECVADGACTAPADITNYDYPCPDLADDYPVVCVDWFQANDYCSWKNALLPTEAQWEKAARGTDERIYPWGNAPPTCTLANHYECGVQLLPVGSKPAGASPYGALDMSGNVFEWVSDWYLASYYVRSPHENPTGPATGTRRMIRSSGVNWAAARASNRPPDYDAPTPFDMNIDVGIRCAYPPPID